MNGDYDPLITGCFEDWDHLWEWEAVHGALPNGRWIIAGLPHTVEDGWARRC